MQIKLNPFTVPNYVIQSRPPSSRAEGFKEPNSYPLSEVDAETLAEMCDEWRRAVFAKAGKIDPEGGK